MTFKDLNVYQRTYKVAIDLHQFFAEKGEFSTDEINQLKSVSKLIVSQIAEGFSQRTAKAKRFFNFKALDNINAMLLNLDFLKDTSRLPVERYEHFYSEYNISAKQLFKYNQSILAKDKEAAANKENKVLVTA